MGRVKVVDKAVLEVLSRCLVDGHLLRLPEQLDRKLYAKTNDVLVALGGKWSRRAGGHLFDADPRPDLESVLLTGECGFNPHDFYRTPREVAVAVVARAGVEPGDVVLEPSAGDGAIADVLCEYDVGGLVLVEIDTRRADRLEERFCPDGGRPGFAGSLRIVTGDFLDIPVPPRPVDRVAMNPPFSDWHRHFWRALEWLRPGGVISCIAPAGVEFRSDRAHREVREWALANGAIDALPENSFRSSGTTASTSLIVARTAEAPDA